MEFVSVIFGDNLWLTFMMWKTSFIKKLKLFCQLLRKKFGYLSVFINNLANFVHEGNTCWIVSEEAVG